MTSTPTCRQWAAGTQTIEQTMSIKSPCTSVCRMSAVSGYCEGCFRTIPEITEWSRAGNAQKRAILAEVASRRAAAARVDGSLPSESQEAGR